MIEEWKLLRKKGAPLSNHDPYQPPADVSGANLPSIFRLLEAVASGCGICAFLKCEIKSTDGSVSKYFDDCRGSIWYDLRYQSINLCGGNEESSMQQWFEGIPVPDESLCLYEGFTETYTGHSRVLVRGQKWLQTCL